MTIIDMSATSHSPLRDIIEAWAVDRTPPRVRGDAGHIVSLRDYLAEGELVAGIPAQLDSTSASLLEEIVPPGDLEDFDGTEQDTAFLLLIELVRQRGDDAEVQRLQEIRASRGKS